MHAYLVGGVKNVGDVLKVRPSPTKPAPVTGDPPVGVWKSAFELKEGEEDRGGEEGGGEEVWMEDTCGVLGAGGEGCCWCCCCWWWCFGGDECGVCGVMASAAETIWEVSELKQ
jgi:hypothetical protein